MIGIFDSGLGGLTAVEELRKAMPEADFVYFGDTARIPYGTRTVETIRAYALQDCRFLMSLGVTSILIACGTVSTNALDIIRSTFPVPVVGVVEGAAKKAAEIASKGKGRVLVLGTPATVKSGAFEKELRKNGCDSVMSIACPMFVPLAENGYTTVKHIAAVEIAREYLAPALDFCPDAVILGCTHYPLLSEVVSHFLPDSVLVSSGAEAVAELKKSLTSRGVLCGGGKGKYYVSDGLEGFAESARRFLQTPVTDVTAIDINSY